MAVKNNKWLVIFCVLLLPVFGYYTLYLPFNQENQLPLPKPLSASDFPKTNAHAVKLGQLLFFDPILSGNKNISCATCHHPTLGTSDGVALSIGEGGIGLGKERAIGENNRPEERIPRNSPALFNVGALEFTTMFADGRLEKAPNHKQGLRTPLEQHMPEGFSGVLAAQTMFPVLSPDEMAGHYNENEIAIAIRKGHITGEKGAWDLIAQRIRDIPEYVLYFQESYPSIQTADDIQFTDIANAIAEFVNEEWKSINSPFDRYLHGDKTALNQQEKKGLNLFYGKAQCHQCHSGPLLTDHQFHAIAMPQIGPGKKTRFESHYRDIGRMRITGDKNDRYKFKTPTLRNVVATAPYGHSGAYKTLRDVIVHHTNPVQSLMSYQTNDIDLPDFPEHKQNDWIILNTPEEIEAIISANELQTIELNENDVNNLLAFLGSLTDNTSIEGRLGRPDKVPSGLPFD